MRLFGLIGFPLTHSFSEKYFTEKFKREGITNAMYRNFPITDINLLPDLVKCHPNLHGLNVTIPYKQSVIPFLDELDETARVVGAVNTVLSAPGAVGQKPKLKGFNTDVVGFRQSLKPFLASHHERALILGTGGASKAVEFVLGEIGVECIFASRIVRPSARLPKPGLCGGGQGAEGDKTVLDYSALNEHVIDMCKLIVNCTPVGMYPNVDVAPDIPHEFITKDHFLYDLIYNPEETEFLKRGKAKGALTLNGLDMLKMQAEAAWQIWNR